MLGHSLRLPPKVLLSEFLSEVRSPIIIAEMTSCSGSIFGTALVSQFTLSGISLTSEPTQLRAAAGRSGCLFLLGFVPIHLPTAEHSVDHPQHLVGDFH